MEDLRRRSRTEDDPSCVTPDGGEPTEAEILELRHVSDRIPVTSWLVAAISLTERFTYYGINAPFQNYAQNPLNDNLRPGALGVGQARATNLNDAFQFLVYMSPIGWAIVADTRLGRYRTICIATACYLAGVWLIFATSTPDALNHNAGLGGLIGGIFAAGVGLGGLKACVPPFMAEQYTETKLRVKTTKKNERVIVDRNLTLQSIYSVWYWCVNVGSLSGIATTFLERQVAFWAAYLLPACFLWLAVVVLVFGRRRFVRRQPRVSVLRLAFKVFSYAVGGKFRMDAARPEFQRDTHEREVEWNNGLAFPIVWLCHSQINTNLVSQAAQMHTYGLPNDVFQNISALTVIISMPVMQQLVYPVLQKLKIAYPPINRITAGFVLQAAAMAYASGVQKIIYSAAPCYESPLKCPLSENGSIPNHVSVALQVPAYVLDGLAGTLYYPTGQEYAYTKAPSSMKSFVQAVLMFTVGCGAALAIALSPLYRDPTNETLYACLAGLMFLSACIFAVAFKKYNKTEDDMNRVAAENELDNRESAKQS